MGYRIYRRIIYRIKRRIFRTVFGLCILLGMAYMLSGCTKETEKKTAHETTKEEITTEGQNDASETTSVSNASSAISVTEADDTSETEASLKTSDYTFDISEIPDFDGSRAWVEVNDNNPYFTEDEMQSKCFEKYSELDEYGRCGVAMACIGKDIMPTEERGEIGQIKPSGWHTIKYSEVIEDNHLYNRCHLIAYQLAGDDNEKNLITGTRFLNIDGMLPLENKVANYIYSNPQNHVMYRVTPIYIDGDLVASGVLIEAESIETNEISFCVYCYNEQPGISIDHKTGESEYTGDYLEEAQKKLYESVKRNSENEGEEVKYILNTNSGKFHTPECDSVREMKEKNKKETALSKEELIEQGYAPCHICIGE